MQTRHQYALIRSQNVFDRRFSEEGLVYISDAHAMELKGAIVQQGDVLLNITGDGITFARACLTPINILPACVNQHVTIIRANPELCLPEYLLAYLTHPNIKDYVESFNAGGSRRAITKGHIESFVVPIPSLNEQRAITGILSALDDKIELNRRMNRTLEAMARAVYQEMIKVEGGEEKTIGDVVTVVGGSTPSTANPAFWDGGNIHWATPRDLAPLQSPILLDTNSRITELGLKEISSGLLPVGTVLLSSRAPIGYLAINQIPVAINQGFIAIKCTEEVPNYFILNWLKDHMGEIIGRANGTTFLEISKSNFRPMKIIVPLPEKIRVFVETVEPLYQKIVTNLKVSRTLASLRETLMPKLMRGEVRVKDV